MNTTNTNTDTDTPAHAVVYAYRRAQSGGTTPAYTTIEGALTHLYRSGALFDSVRIKRVPHTDQTRHSD